MTTNDEGSWTCPYCNRVATITKRDVSAYDHAFNMSNKYGLVSLRTLVTVCPNDKCKEFTIWAGLFPAKYESKLTLTDPALETWNLRPLSSARPFPDYIPAPILADYKEACLIRDLSPKASATLARRCLQGMIRDFWGISKARLVDEVAELKGKVDSTTWSAIDSVRSIGNIGAHMEKDISVIIDVDPDEAALLLRLIEVLLEEWYVRRFEREEHMKQVIAAAQAKTDAKRQA